MAAVPSKTAPFYIEIGVDKQADCGTYAVYLSNGSGTVTEAGTYLPFGMKIVHITGSGTLTINLSTAYPYQAGYMYGCGIDSDIWPGTTSVTATSTGTAIVVMYIPYIMQDSVMIEAVQGQTIDTLTFRIQDKSKEILIPEGIDIRVWRYNHTATTWDLRFGGIISLVETWIDGVTRWHEVKAQDYTVLLDTTVVMASYKDSYTYDGLSGVKAVIADMFETKVVGDSVTYSEIAARTYVEDAHLTLTRIDFNYVTLREALTSLAGYTQNNFYVDYGKSLHFYFKSSVNYTSSFNLLDSYTGGRYDITYRNGHWRRDATKIRNSFELIGAQTFSEVQSYHLPATGSDKTIYLQDGVGDITGNLILAGMPGNDRISVWINDNTDLNPNWVSQTVGIDNYDPYDGSYDVYWNALQQKLVFWNYPPSYATNAILVGAVYTFTNDNSQKNTSSYAKYGRYFVKKVPLSEPNSINGWTSVCKAYELEWAFALSRFTCTIDDGCYLSSDTERFSVGDWVVVTFDDITLTMQVRRVVTKVIGADQLQYDLELRDWYSDSIA